jgi:GAF domain-containing protein
VRRGEPLRDLLEFMVTELMWHFPTYAWAGVYVAEGEVLKLGPFRGPESPHHSIRIGVEGICGWVAQHAVPQVIPDVNADPRYLSCSASIRSEIVVPIQHDGRVWGVIDIDSEAAAAFTQRDLDVLLDLARVVGGLCRGRAPWAYVSADRYDVAVLEAARRLTWRDPRRPARPEDRCDREGRKSGGRAFTWLHPHEGALGGRRECFTLCRRAGRVRRACRGGDARSEGGDGA